MLIVTNAAGGLNPSFNVGDIMILKVADIARTLNENVLTSCVQDHINFLGMAGTTGLMGSNGIVVTSWVTIVRLCIPPMIA